MCGTRIDLSRNVFNVEATCGCLCAQIPNEIIIEFVRIHILTYYCRHTHIPDIRQIQIDLAY